MEILPLKSQYIFSILLFVVKNKKLFISNYDSHNIWTRQCEDLHYPSTVLTLYKKDAYFMGIKIFNKLSSHLKELVKSPKIFKRTLKKILSFSLSLQIGGVLWHFVFTNWRSFMALTLNLFLRYLHKLNLNLSVCV
jgi:hypothetical protein